MLWVPLSGAAADCRDPTLCRHAVNPREITRRVPKPHQRYALRWGRELDRVGWFLEMRLGKSLIAARWLLAKKDPWPALIIAPLSVLPVWQDELAAEGTASVLLRGSAEERLRLAEEASRSFCLMNPQGLYSPGHRTLRGKVKPVPSLVALYPWRSVIVDESTCLKNPKAVTSRVASFAFKHAIYKACLSGLPNPKSLLDFFQQMLFLHESFLGCENYWRFRDRHFIQLDPFGSKWAPKKGFAVAMKEHLKLTCHFLTRKEAGLGNEKVFERRYISLPQKVRRAYNNAEKHFELGDTLTQWTFEVRNWLSQMCGGRSKGQPDLHHNAKLNELLELLTGELEGQSVVVWARYRREITAIRDAIRSQGITCSTYTGSTPVEKRGIRTQEFQDGKLQVLVVQQQTGKFGLNLSRSSTSIYFSLLDDPEAFAQSLDRLEHLEKKEPLLYLFLLAQDTIDEDRYQSLREQHRDSKAFMSSYWERFRERVERGRKQ